MPTGCRFLERCGYAQSGCKSDQPLAEIEPGRLARCSRAADIELPGATA
jgi:peptide/nickel transport system ATP-binding protein